MILAILCMAGAIVIGLGNKDTLEETIDKLEGLKADVTRVGNELGEAEDQRDDAQEREGQAKDKRNMASAAVEGVKQNLKILAKSVDDKSADLKKIEIEKKEIDLLIAKVFPNGVETADELNAKLTMMRDALTEKQNVATNLDAQVAAAVKTRQGEVAKVKQEEAYQIGRAQKLALNGMVATVVAVNNDWGFVMVNAGRAHGVGADSSLLVKRGNARVGRLRIVNLQDMASVCDVVKDSTGAGVKIQPGDKVIFETSAP